MNASQTIPAVAEAFGTDRPFPVIGHALRPAPESRWDRGYAPRRVSRSYLRTLQRIGYTRVRLSLNGITHEFAIEDLLR